MPSPGTEDRPVVDAPSGAVTHTPGPWDYVPSTEHHGPYITSDFGSTIADFYVMSQPTLASERNGGPSHPVHFMSEMANPNARLGAAAPELLPAAQAMLALVMLKYGNLDADVNTLTDQARAAIAKATGASDALSPQSQHQGDL